MKPGPVEPGLVAAGSTEICVRATPFATHRFSSCGEAPDKRLHTEAYWVKPNTVTVL